MNKPLQNEVMSADEAALYLDIPKPRLLKLVREGQIPGVKVGRSWKFSFSVLEKWQDSKKKSPSDRALNISNPLNRSDTTTPSNKDLLKEKTNKSNNTNPHIPPNANLVNPQNYSNPNLAAQNNTQNKTPQIIVNSVILWGGIGRFSLASYCVYSRGNSVLCLCLYYEIEKKKNNTNLPHIYSQTPCTCQPMSQKNSGPF